MPVHFKPRWALPERAATPESVFRNRRAFLKTAGIAAGTIAAGPASANIFDRLLGGDDMPTPDVENDPSAGLYPAPRNEAYQVMRPITRREPRHHLQQLLRVRLPQADLQGRAAARHPARGP